MWLLYQVLFYKLFRLANWTRETEDASYAAGMTLGGLFWYWLVLAIELLDLRKYLPKGTIMILLICCVIVNLVIITKDRRYLRIIENIEKASIPLAFHIIAYVLFAWTIVGIVIAAMA